MIRTSIYKPVHQTIGCVLQNVECASKVLWNFNTHFKELKFSNIREHTMSQKVDLTKYVLHKLSTECISGEFKKNRTKYALC